MSLTALSHLFRYFLFLFSLISVFAAAVPTASDYGALPSMQMVAISPNGGQIAYRKVANGQDVVMVTGISDRKNLLTVDVSSIQPQQIYFLNDKQLLMVASEFRRVEGFLGKFDLSTAFLLNLEDKKIRQLLIPGDKILAGQTGLGNVVGTTTDGKYLLMPAWTDVNNMVRESVYSLFKVDLTRKFLTLATDGGGKKADDFFVNREGETIAIEEYNDKTDLHRILAKHGNDWTPVFSETVAIRTKSFVGVTADFKSLVFIEQNTHTNHSAYMLMSLADGAVSGPIFAKDNADIAGVIRDTQRVVYGVRYSGFVPSYQFFDPTLTHNINNIVAKFPEHAVYLSNWSPDWKHIVVNVAGSNYAEDYFLFSADKAPVFLTSSRPQIKTEDINPIGRVTFAARDGLKIPTLITIPRTKANELKNLPAVIFPHGGPESHDDVSFDYFAQALASQGYLVIQPQFRGSSGFGFKHRDAGFGEWGKKMQDDLSDAVNFFSSKGIIDAQRLCIAGASYGGYAALAGGAFTPELYKCVVSINGISDLNDMLTYDRNTRGKDSEVTAYWELQLSKGEISKQELDKVSPGQFAQQFKAPVLLIHSANDKIVQPEQSQHMLKMLKQKDKPAQLVILEGDDHHLQEAATRTKAVAELVNFVHQHLQ